jgi:predicted nucleotidyltransferase component of viral defense system
MKLSTDSFNQRIKNYAQEKGIVDVNILRTAIVLERLVARIMSVEFLERKLIFCGGFVLFKEGYSERYTKDIDMISNHKDHKRIIEEIKKAISKDLSDGFWFGDPLINEIPIEETYGGVRFRPLFKIGLPKPTKNELKRLKRVQLDLSFQPLSDDMISKSGFNSFFDSHQDITWEILPIEYTAADKIHAVISREGLSTRSKDVYDLSIILPKCDKNSLRRAISSVFSTRNTNLWDSLPNILKNIDTGSLENNWKNLKLIDNFKTFNECWGKVKNYFDNF